MDSLILASKSPRRSEILKSLGIPFIIFPPENFVERSIESGIKIRLSVIKNSRGKALNVSKNFENGLILGVDTIVFLGNKALGKPSNKIEARKYLRILSGKMHIVYSGITLIDVKSWKIISNIAKTEVCFKKLSIKEIDDYIRNNEWIDKAGGYAIQGKASFYIKEIRGSFYNVVGLPVEMLYDMLKKFDYFRSIGKYSPLRKL